jgi:hypothetical protein
MDPAKISEILSGLNLRLDEINDERIANAITLLFQIIEELSSQNVKMAAEIDYLRNEINRLKGDNDDMNKNVPDEKKSKDHSSENERKKRKSPKKPKSKTKKHKIPVDRTEICEVDKTILPQDAEFKGFKDVIVQEIKITTDNVLYKKEIYYSKSERKTYIGSLPEEIKGEFGPGIKSMVYVMKHVCNISEPKIAEFFDNFGLFISQPTISRMLTKGGDVEIFQREKMEIFTAGLNSTTYQHIDGTGAIVNGENHHVQIICNPYYTAYFTREHKDRLSIIDIFLCGGPRYYYFNEEALDLLEGFRISGKLRLKIREESFGKLLDEEEMRRLLEQFFPDPGKGKNNRLRIMEAGAIAYYHNQTQVPVVRHLLSDNGPEYGKITENRGLCWIHGGRSYKKLTPVVPAFQETLENFLNRYWDYYQCLLDYKDNPDPKEAEKLSLEFDAIFSTETDYPALNARIEKTRSKKAGYLLVLQYPEIGLHNNPAELGARAQSRKRDVSLHTISEEGTKSQDTILTIVETAKKLGISAYEYIFDRIGGKFEMTSLASLIPQPKYHLKPLYDTS